MIYVVTSIIGNEVHSDIVNEVEVQATFRRHAAGYEDLLDEIMHDDDPMEWSLDANDFYIYVSKPKHVADPSKFGDKDSTIKKEQVVRILDSGEGLEFVKYPNSSVLDIVFNELYYGRFDGEVIEISIPQCIEISNDSYSTHFEEPDIIRIPLKLLESRFKELMTNKRG